MLVDLLLVALLLPIVWIDSRKLVIPDWANLGLGLVGVTVSYAMLARAPILILAEAAAVTATTILVMRIYAGIRGQDGLGWGDVKMLAALSTWVGAYGAAWVVLIASLSGLALVVVQWMRLGDSAFERRWPFGPHLAVGLFVVWVSRNFLLVGQ